MVGDLKRLEQIGQHLLQAGLAKEHPLSIAWASHFLGHAYYQWNRLEEAAAHWSTVAKWRYHANFLVYHDAMLGLVLIHHSQGNVTQAQQTLDTLTQVMLEINQIQFAPQLESFRTRLALLRGEVGIAVHWLQTGVKPARMSLWFWEANEYYPRQSTHSAGNGRFPSKSRRLVNRLPAVCGRNGQRLAAHPDLGAAGAAGTGARPVRKSPDRRRRGCTVGRTGRLPAPVCGTGA